MRMIWNKGHRIRASDKHLVYHFSIGTLLFVFVAVLLLLNIKQLMRTDWEHFSLLENGLTLSPYNFITILIATGVCALVVFLYYHFCYDSYCLPENRRTGLLDPFVIMKNVKDAESLAIDILTFLTGISSRDGEKFPVLRKAVRSVTQSDSRGLLHVIDELRREDTPISRNIADHIDSFTDYDFAHLLFSDGTVENAISLDNQLNIIQVADLVLPDKDTTFEEYTTIELLSVSMLIVISTFALDFIHSDRSIFKIVDLDEAWAFLNVAQGETLSNKLVRAGRAMQAGVYFVTQSSGDVAKESLKNNIGLKFAFRSTDINEIKQTLEFFGIDKDDENNQKRLRDLENGQCLLQDLYGRVGVVQIHPVFEELLHAFDTRPPVQRNEVE